MTIDTTIRIILFIALLLAFAAGLIFASCLHPPRTCWTCKYRHEACDRCVKCLLSDDASEWEDNKRGK